MSYVDKNLEFSDAQAVTATAISSNVYDLFTTDLGAGANITPNSRLDISTPDLWFVVAVPTAITDAGSDATLVVTLESADDVGLTTNAQVHFSTGTLAFATYSPAGTQLACVRLPRGLYRRYLGVRFTVASGPFTGGALDAYLTPDMPNNRVYKAGFTVQ